MNHRRKGKRKYKLNSIDIELEAFIFGCFFYTWNKIFTENVRKKKKGNKRSTSGVNKLSFRVSSSKGAAAGAAGGRSIQSLSVGKTTNTVKRKSNPVVAPNKTCAVKTANALEVPTLEKHTSRKSCGDNEGTLPHASSSHIRSNLSEEFQRKYKIDIDDLNEQLLHFVKLNFCLNENNFHIFHDLYSFYDHIREEKKDEEVYVHRVFLKTDEGCAPQGGEWMSSPEGTSMGGRSAVGENSLRGGSSQRRGTHKGAQKVCTSDGSKVPRMDASKLSVADWSNHTCTWPAKCPFCELPQSKEKGVKALRRQKFIHACIRRVYGEKNLQLVNKCIINIKTFDDSFIHSITIERLFSYINEGDNRNLLFFWFEFLNVLLKVTMNKQRMIQIFFFFCVKNLLISTYFNREQMMGGGDEFTAGKTFSTKGQEKNPFLTKMLKKYKCETFSNIVLNNNYRLLQNLFDYFFMVCSTSSLKFYDNFFLNVQMINFIYLVQVNFFHYYYIGLCSKFFRWEAANRGERRGLVISTSQRGSGYIIRLPKQTELAKDVKEKIGPFSRLKRKDGEAVNPATNLCTVKKGQRKESTVGAKFRRVTGGGGGLQKGRVSAEGEQIGPMSQFTCTEEFSSPHGRSSIGGISIGKHYNVGGKRPCKVNLSYHNYVRGGRGRQGRHGMQFSISRYVARHMGGQTPMENTKIGPLESRKVAPMDSNMTAPLPPNEEMQQAPPAKRLARNLKIFFSRSNIFLNKYIQSEQLTKQSNIFSFLFDALPSDNLHSNVSNTLEPYILSIFSKYQFIQVDDFVESLKRLYNLKRERKKGKKKILQNSEQSNVKFLNDLQGFNYIYHNLKNDYLMLAESLYFDMQGEREKGKQKEKGTEKAKDTRQKHKYNKVRISNLIQNEKTDTFRNVSIYKFSSKKWTVQHNLFNIYLECSLLNKALKLLMIDFNFSFSLTSEVIFLYKMYLIELKRKNILFAFENLSMSFNKCFILLKKYLCNPTSFKLLSLISLHFSNLIFNYPFLRAYLSFCPNDKIRFLRSNIILHENVTANCYYNDYFSHKNDVDGLNLLCEDGWDGRGRCRSVQEEGSGNSRREALPEEISSCVGEEAASSPRPCNSRAMYTSQGLYNWQNNSVDSGGRFAPLCVVRGEMSPSGRDPGGNEGERGSALASYGQCGQYDHCFEAGARDKRGLRSDSVAPSARGPFPSDEEPFCGNAAIDLCRSIARGAASSRGGGNNHRNASRRSPSHRNAFHRSAPHRSASRISSSRRANLRGDHRTWSHSSDESSHEGGSGRHHRFLSQQDHLFMRKIVQSFNFIFNILDKMVTSCEVSFLSKEAAGRVFHRPTGKRPTGERPNVHLQMGRPPLEPPPFDTPYIHAQNSYQENVGNMTNFIKEVVNKVDSYFCENFSRKDIKKHIEQLERKKYSHFLYESKAMRSMREAHDDSFFCCLEFLFLAYICSNYFSDHVSGSYKDCFKSFNFNNIWPSNQQIKVKILLSLIHLLLHQINVINLNPFFLQILKIILNKFYSHLDYNDVQMFQYIYMSLSNETLFSSFSICDEIRDVIRGSFGSVREFSYVFDLSRRRDAFSLCRLGCAGDDPLGEDLFVTNLLEFLLRGDAAVRKEEKRKGGKRKEDRPNVAELLNGERPDVIELPKGDPLNETALWEDTPFSECPHNETIRDDSAVGEWVDRFSTQGEDEQYGSHPKYQFDDFKSEASFEKNDFVFFKKSEKWGGRDQITKQGGRSSFLDNILLHLDKKNTNGKRSPMKRIPSSDEAAERHNNGTHTKLHRTGRRHLPMREKTHGGQKSAEEKYKQMLYHFKVSKEEYIENNLNRRNEWLIRLKTWRDRYHYYENVKPDHYEAYHLEKEYYLPEELFETNCFILAEEKHQMRIGFNLEKNNYLSECLNLLRMIDLYMECRSSTYNRPLYFVKSLIVTCLSVSYSRHLSVVYIHALIRLCLFELRMDNAHTSVCILLEILTHFEQIKSYRNVMGIIFYLCGYSLLHQFNLQSERLEGERRKRELIKEYHHHLNMKREIFGSFQRCKLGRSTFGKSCNTSHKSGNPLDENCKTPDISPIGTERSHVCNNQEGEDQGAADSDSTNGGERAIGSVAMSEGRNLDPTLSEHSHRSSNYTSSPQARQKSAPEHFARSVERRTSSCVKGSLSKGGSAKCARKLIPLVKNQIKITDYFSNVKNEKVQEALSDADSTILDSDHIHLNSSEKKCVKKRRKNDGLTHYVVQQQERPPTETNLQNKNDQPYDTLEEINKKQFFLLLICFYMKRALYHWENDGDAVGISNGIQQKRRMKDALFFLMSSYKFFYKSSLFLSKHERIGSFKFPLFDFQLFEAYKTFYAFYRGAFLRCCNANVTFASRG
ncbi:hypothetical protein C922_03105 [Plasmodium inui San Antonio 1]|uniref:Uncharacterized protein n=1 Tax=Plasmodium inui San Antonio 1 TaxID=1237626 RepID=W7AMC4_9APIC|nr:hypothetical protein C922_03105 [Plasmodium inui San Antonio 1]EUD66471.1 hypothetical protein C922_03105 [Plasmodium inui San Antonio 1]